MRSTDLQIDWLRSFVCAVDGGSLTLAANMVHRSQAAVSMQIRKLEQALGAPVLVRDAHKLSLTAVGRQLLPHARHILDAHHQAKAVLHGPAVRGQLTLGIPDDYAVGYLSTLLRRFNPLYPEVEITLVCAQSTELLPRIEADEIDLAIVSRDRPDRGQLLFNEPLVWVGEIGSELWRREPLPVAIYEEGSVARTATETALLASARRFRLAYHSPGLAGQIAAAESGLAVAVLTRCSVPSSLQLLDARHNLPALPALPVTLVQSRSARNSPPARAMHEQIIACLLKPESTTQEAPA